MLDLAEYTCWRVSYLLCMRLIGLMACAKSVRHHCGRDRSVRCLLARECRSRMTTWSKSGGCGEPWGRRSTAPSPPPPFPPLSQRLTQAVVPMGTKLTRRWLMFPC